MKPDSKTKRAMAAGRRQAADVLVARDEILRKKRRAPKKHLAAQGMTEPSISTKLLTVVGEPPQAGVLVAEGDSWFDYPFHDVLSVLEDEYDYDVEDVAHKGDRVEDMAYEGGQLDRFTRKIEKLLRRRIVPKAILLSGGGNDVAGDEFRVLLNHLKSPVPGINTDVMNGIVDQRIRYSYITILTAVTQVCKKRLGRTLPILTHGYDYPVPDGRGYWGGWGPLPGPWLEPGFRDKGYEDLSERIEIIGKLIDRLNRMFIEVSKLDGFSHVNHIDLRGTLSTGTSYKKWWDNELHPTEKGFERVTKKFAEALNDI